MRHDYIPPLGNLTVVSGEDPAIDLAATPVANLNRYMETRDLPLLTMIPAARPVKYTLREMPDSAYQWVCEGTTNEEKWMRALEVCLESVENHYEPGGAQHTGVLTLTSFEAPALDNARRALRADVLRLVKPRGVLWELGSLCLWRAELAPKARRVYVMLPGSRSRILGRYSDAETIERLNAAEQTQNHGETSGATTPATAGASDSTGPETPKAAPSSGASG